MPPGSRQGGLDTPIRRAVCSTKSGRVSAGSAGLPAEPRWAAQPPSWHTGNRYILMIELPAGPAVVLPINGSVGAVGGRAFRKSIGTCTAAAGGTFPWKVASWGLSSACLGASQQIGLCRRPKRPTSRLCRRSRTPPRRRTARSRCRRRRACRNWPPRWRRPRRRCSRRRCSTP
jgi:hypothetical protein